MADLVNHPEHYKTASGLEAIEIIEQGLDKYDHRDQVFKYLLRAPKKGNPVQDLQKAQWYLNRTVQNALEGKFTFNKVEFETYNPLENQVAVRVNEEAESAHEYDRSKIYMDSFDCLWKWFEEQETWAWGPEPEDRTLRASVYSDLEDLCAEPKSLFDPFTKKETKPEYDKEKVWKDKDGDFWECIEGAWVTGDTHEERVRTALEFLELGSYYTNLSEDYAPYTEVETRRKFDETKRYIDSDGDIWGFYDGHWYFGGNHQKLEARFGKLAYQWNLPCVDIENCMVVENEDENGETV